MALRCNRREAGCGKTRNDEVRWLLTANHKVKGSGQERLLHSGMVSGCQRVGLEQAAVEVEVVVDHPFGGETFPGARKGAIGIGVAQGAVGIELGKNCSQAARAVGAEVECGVAPDFAEAWDIVGDDGAAGESSVERGHAERLVTRSGRS